MTKLHKNNIPPGVRVIDASVTFLPHEIGRLRQTTYGAAACIQEMQHKTREIATKVYLTSLGPSKFGHNSFIFHPISK